jgi:radical SAM superfamily enzyme YgiQ (UPF0313 family)
LLRNEEAAVSLSIASLLAYLKNDARYDKNFTVQHLPINMWQCSNPQAAAYQSIRALPLKNIDTIGISCYIWNEYLINPLINKLRVLGFLGKIALGGYQISYSNQQKIQNEYPQADIFIFGNGEQSFLDAIFLKKPITPICLNKPVDFQKIPSVYLTQELPVVQNQKMVRWETKRGCPYKCTFCAHRDLTKNKVCRHEIRKLFAEIDFFKKKNIGRINILDPIFNAGGVYLDILQEIKRINLTSTITMQTRFELVQGTRGDDFLRYCKNINAHLEFGLQTAIEAESRIIDRRNNIDKIRAVLKKLNADNISYEVSLIYGLPRQTVGSFEQSIDFLRANGCKNIVAYPLMLLKGTALYHQKNKYKILEKVMGKFRIPTVISSDSFTETQWLEMASISKKLNENYRY